MITRKRLWRMVMIAIIMGLMGACVPATPVKPTSVTPVTETPTISGTEHKVTLSPTVEAVVEHTPTPVQTEESIVTITPVTLRQGDQWPARGERTFLLITGPRSWATFLKQQQANRFPWPDIDWEHEVVLVALMGAKRTGGYRITLRQVTVKDGRVTVMVEERTPQPGEMVIQVLTSPFHVVSVPRTQLPKGPFVLTFVGQMKGQRWQVHVSDLASDTLYRAEATFTLPQKGEVGDTTSEDTK